MRDAILGNLCGVVLLAAATGCNGPLAVPMVKRLPPESQANIEQAWDNLLMPVDRLDRTLLLDVIMVHQLHSTGVDRLRMTSEKYIDGAVVRMEVIFDRDNPEGDAFAVAVFDDEGNELRYESYSSDEIGQRIDALYGVRWSIDGLEASADADDDAEAAREARREEILAATQPAVEP